MRDGASIRNNFPIDGLTCGCKNGRNACQIATSKIPSFLQMLPVKLGKTMRYLSMNPRLQATKGKMRCLLSVRMRQWKLKNSKPKNKTILLMYKLFLIYPHSYTFSLSDNTFQ